MSSQKVVAVVGAAGGVGLEVASILQERGYRVLATVLDGLEEARLRDRVAVEGVLQLDLAQVDDLPARLGSELFKLGHPLAGVIVCAAISPFGPLELMPLADLRRTIEINTIAGVAVYQACMPRLRQSRGRLVFMSSFAGKLALPFIGHYVASKFALEGLCDVMRREAAHFGVDVVMVEPGGIRTTMVSDQIERIAEQIEALRSDDAELYGHRYREFQGLLQASFEATNPPAYVADIVVAAFEAVRPEPRYIAGDDAKALIARAANSTDAELDVFLNGMYASYAPSDRVGAT